MLHPENFEKTLEIYEYYDGPLSSLVLFKEGQRALVEVFNWSHETKELWELAVLIESDAELAKLKEEKPLLKDFFRKKVEKKQVFLWHYTNRICNASVLDEVSLLEFTKNMSDEYKFEGNSEDWNHILENCCG